MREIVDLDGAVIQTCVRALVVDGLAGVDHALLAEAAVDLVRSRERALLCAHGLAACAGVGALGLLDDDLGVEEFHPGRLVLFCLCGSRIVGLDDTWACDFGFLERGEFGLFFRVFLTFDLVSALFALLFERAGGVKAVETLAAEATEELLGAGFGFFEESVCHLLHSFGDSGIAFLEGLDNVHGETLLAGVLEERDCCTLVAGTTRAATAVDIVFQVCRAVEVEYHGEAGYVETASGDGGSDEDGKDTLLEVVDGFVTICLILGAVDGVHRVVLSLEEF